MFYELWTILMLIVAFSGIYFDWGVMTLIPIALLFGVAMGVRSYLPEPGPSLIDGIENQYPEPEGDA